MVYELRRPIFDLSGSLAAAVASNDAQITAKGSLFTGLPTDYSAGLYLPLILANDALGKSEVVWATGHASASPTMTVVRGREGTAQATFDPGDVIRCGPTVRDVVSGVATRAALPADAHIGMRVVILSEAQVVEKTSAGWNDSAPMESDSTRKHHWQQAGAALVANSVTTAIGMSSTQVGTAGTIATLAAGQLTLNRAGMWSLKNAMFGANASNRNQGVTMNWPDGAFMTSPYQIAGVIGGAGAAGNGIVEATWVGYVTAAQAAKPIACSYFSTLALSGAQYDVHAEYLGA